MRPDHFLIGENSLHNVHELFPQVEKELYFVWWRHKPPDRRNKK
jgi:hypothetical protein